jgi:hypothetical protein
MSHKVTIRHNMAVVAADGRRVGFVSRLLDGDVLRVTRFTNGHGYDHLVPLAWVAGVDRYVHLNKASAYVAANCWAAARAPATRGLALPATAPDAPADPDETVTPVAA